MVSTVQIALGFAMYIIMELLDRGGHYPLPPNNPCNLNCALQIPEQFGVDNTSINFCVHAYTRLNITEPGPRSNFDGRTYWYMWSPCEPYPCNGYKSAVCISALTLSITHMHAH